MGVMDMISSFLNPEDAYSEAANVMQNYWNEGKKYSQPYANRGNEVYPQLSEAMQKLLNPQALQNEWSQGYEESPYAHQLIDINKGQGMDAASSMGLLGSSGALQNIQQGAGMISAQDRRNYMTDLMEKFMKGIGIGGDIYNTGASSANSLMTGALNTGQDMASLKFGEERAPGALFENLLKGLGNASSAGLFSSGGIGSGGGKWAARTGGMNLR